MNEQSPEYETGRKAMSETSLARVESTALTMPSWGEMKEQAAMLVKSGFLPKAVNTPEKAIAIMLAGRELNIPPMAALRGLYVIDGKVTANAQTMLALAQRSGELEQFHADDQDNHCTITIKRRGFQQQVITWSDADTNKAGLGGGFAWQKYPRVMRRWRATTEALRLVFADVLAGMYTPDELGVGYRVEGDDIVVDVEAQVVDTSTGEIVEAETRTSGNGAPARQQMMARIGELTDQIAELTNNKRYNTAHIRNHLRKHYDGCDTLSSMTDDQLLQFGKALRFELDELEAATDNPRSEHIATATQEALA